MIAFANSHAWFDTIGLHFVIRPFEKRSYSAVAASARPSMCPSEFSGHFSREQTAPRTVLFVCMAVCYTFFTMFVKFLGVITIDKSDVHAKGQGQSAKGKVTEVKTQFSNFRTVTPVWITYGDEMMHEVWCGIREVPYCFVNKRGALLFCQCHSSNFKVTRHKNIQDFDQYWAFPECNSTLN